MEETLFKIATSEQLKRAKAFTFIVKVYLAILAIYRVMNYLGYRFNNREIKMNTVLTLLLSKEAILALIIYLIWVFIFFWFFKLILYVSCLNWLNNPCTSEENEKNLTAAKMLIMNEKGKLVFRNVKDKDTVRFVSNDLSYPGDSVFVKLFSELLSLMFATNLIYWIYYIDKLFPVFHAKWIGVSLAVLSIFISAGLIFYLKMYCRMSSKINELLVNISRNEML